MLSCDYILGIFIEEIIIYNKIEQSRLAIIKIQEEVIIVLLAQSYVWRFS